MNHEVDAIQARYAQRKLRRKGSLYPRFSAFQHFSRAEREYWYSYFLNARFPDYASLRFLEVGAGGGANPLFFVRLGFDPAHVFANELLPERCEQLLRVVRPENILAGNALDIQAEPFDVILLSTVFSSILENRFQEELARKVWILDLFPHSRSIEMRKVTLAPPIGRRVGRWYFLLNFPFLRTHVVAAINKI